MINRFAYSALALLSLGLFSCKPKPIDIAVPQQERRLAISSALYDANTVFVTAGYSISSFYNLTDTVANAVSGKDRSGQLVDNGLVTITSAAGHTDTLKRISAGLFGSRSLLLQAGETYTLRVKDLATGIAATATTTYQPEPQVIDLQALVKRTAKDTTARLRVKLAGIQPGQYYFVSYTSVSVATDGLAAKVGLPVLNAFEPRKVELFGGQEATGGILEKEIPMMAGCKDSVYVHVGRIDHGYFEYLSAYKRSGNLVSQLTGEPVHLPANVQPGYGYFALYLPHRRLYDLSQL